MSKDVHTVFNYSTKSHQKINDLYYGLLFYVFNVQLFPWRKETHGITFCICTLIIKSHKASWFKFYIHIYLVCVWDYFL